MRRPREAVEGMALGGVEPYRSLLLSGSVRFLGSELKSTADETLFLELALRGYDLSRLRDDEGTGEVVKIG